ncbi:MAG: hypothetical protein JWP92_3743 [Caulobacter sp.]|nr:hypothetical protein [Caulobacter sp.]
MSLQARQLALSATVEHFMARPFAFGKTDCVRMAAFHLRKMGHRPSLVKAGSYSSLIGAMRALRRTGFASLPDALDAMGLPRIAPAAALVGDLLALPGEDALHALQVVAGNGRVFGFHADSETACFLQPTLSVAMAWRVEPR